MSPRLLAVSCLVVLTLLSGCGRGGQTGVPPKPAPRVGVDTPIPNPKPEDAERVQAILSESVPSAPDTMPVDVRSLPDVATARRSFPPILVPTDTRGRRLVGIVHFQTLGKVPLPRETLTLVYEGGLLVRETRLSPPVARPRPPGPPQSREETSVGDTLGAVETAQLNSPGPPEVRVTFTRAPAVYVVSARGVTPDDLVRVARSMR